MAVQSVRFAFIETSPLSSTFELVITNDSDFMINDITIVNSKGDYPNGQTIYAQYLNPEGIAPHTSYTIQSATALDPADYILKMLYSQIKRRRYVTDEGSTCVYLDVNGNPSEF